MNAIALARQHMKVEFRPVDGPGAHPDSLAHLGDDEIQQLLQTHHHVRMQAVQELCGPRDLLKGQGGTAYVGYDCEWYQRGQRLYPVSYQFYLVGEGGDLAAVFFPESGQLEDRLALADMLPALITKGLENGCLLDYPSQIVLVGFFLRADLAMLKDLVQFKTELGNVGGKIATTRKPVDFQVLYRQSDMTSSNTKVVVSHG